MAAPVVTLHEDHLHVKLDRMASIAALSGDLVVPYSQVAAVDVVAPEWPPAFPLWRVGTYLPRLVAKGRFRASWRGPQRFLWLDRTTSRVLRLQLQGHPSYAEVALDVPDAERLRDAIEARRAKR